jgi:putative iron-regulated protein
MDESYVDSVKGKATAGLINNTAFEITKASLAEQNERGGEENIATGWHAIEFFLWGQDLNANGPGQRSYTDFVDGKSKNADRRRKYLTVVTELLIDDLTMVTGEWRAGSKVNYRSKFVKGGNESLRKMLVGLGSLSRGELAGERMEVALNSRDQEDEHSCFSDNTHRDVVANAQGIQNVWLGSYRRADGTVVKGASLAELVAAKNKAAADKTSKQLAESVAAANAIKPPFDQEILNNEGRARIQRTIKSLVQQSKDIVSAANAVGISKLTLVQP